MTEWVCGLGELSGEGDRRATGVRVDDCVCMGALASGVSADEGVCVYGCIDWCVTWLVMGVYGCMRVGQWAGER